MIPNNAWAGAERKVIMTVFTMQWYMQYKYPSHICSDTLSTTLIATYHASNISWYVNLYALFPTKIWRI